MLRYELEIKGDNPGGLTFARFTNAPAAHTAYKMALGLLGLYVPLTVRPLKKGETASGNRKGLSVTLRRVA